MPFSINPIGAAALAAYVYVLATVFMQENQDDYGEVNGTLSGQRVTADGAFLYKHMKYPQSAVSGWPLDPEGVIVTPTPGLFLRMNDMDYDYLSTHKF